MINNYLSGVFKLADRMRSMRTNGASKNRDWGHGKMRPFSFGPVAFVVFVAFVTFVAFVALYVCIPMLCILVSVRMWNFKDGGS